MAFRCDARVDERSGKKVADRNRTRRRTTISRHAPERSGTVNARRETRLALHHRDFNRSPSLERRKFDYYRYESERDDHLPSARSDERGSAVLPCGGSLMITPRIFARWTRIAFLRFSREGRFIAVSRTFPSAQPLP